MGRISTIDQLPDSLRKKLIELLQKPSVTQKEITEIINDQAGETVVTKSSVNRYAQRMAKQIERTRQAREVAESYIRELGDPSKNNMGAMLNEQLRFMVYDLISEVQEMKESDEVDTGLVTNLVLKLTRGLRSLEEADKLNADRELKIKKAALEEAAEQTEKILSKSGISKEKTLEIKKGILGV